MIRSWAGAALLVALLGAGARAEGERRVALIVRGLPPDPAAAEVLARIRGELRAARFDIDAPLAAEGTPRQVVEAEARHPGVAAAMGIFFDVPQPEVWVAEARSGRTTVEPLMDPVDGERRASALAAKAVDLLKAVLAEVPAGERRPAPPAPPVVVQVPAAAEAAPARGQRIVVAGVTWLRAGSAQTLAPSVSVTWLGGRLGGRLVVAGLGTSTGASALAGSASARQDFALLEALACWRPGSRLRACLGAGGGVELLRVSGTPAPGFEAPPHDLWSGVAVAGGTLIWAPRRWLALAVDARAVGAWPSTNVRIDGASAIHAGGPGVALTAGLGASL